MKQYTDKEIATAKQNMINTIVFFIFLLFALFIENFI
jgi:hypothetical protein